MKQCSYCYQAIERIDCKTGLMLTAEDVGDCSGGPPASSRIISLWDGTVVPSHNVEFSSSFAFRLDKIVSGASSKVELYTCNDFAKTKQCKKIWESTVWIGTNEECGITADCSDQYCAEPHFTSANGFTIEKVKGSPSHCKIQENPVSVKCVVQAKK